MPSSNYQSTIFSLYFFLQLIALPLPPSPIYLFVCAHNSKLHIRSGTYFQTHKVGQPMTQSSSNLTQIWAGSPEFFLSIICGQGFVCSEALLLKLFSLFYIVFCTSIVLNLCQADSKEQHQN